MALLVANAAGLWRQIPDELLPEVVEEGIALAGGFEANAGHVAKAWATRSTSRLLELGAGVRHYGEEALDQMAEFDAYWKSLTLEEQEAEIEKRLAVCRVARAKLGAA